MACSNAKIQIVQMNMMVHMRLEDFVAENAIHTQWRYAQQNQEG